MLKLLGFLSGEKTAQIFSARSNREKEARRVLNWSVQIIKQNKTEFELGLSEREWWPSEGFRASSSRAETGLKKYETASKMAAHFRYRSVRHPLIRTHTQSIYPLVHWSLWKRLFCWTNFASAAGQSIAPTSIGRSTVMANGIMTVRIFCQSFNRSSSRFTKSLVRPSRLVKRCY